MALTLVVLAASVLDAGSGAAQKSTLPTIEAARRILAMRPSGERLGSISLTGFDFSRELELGGGLRVIAISNALGGGLAAFRADGSAIAMLESGRITSLQLFDLNEDGVSEVIADEVESRGTGVLMKDFVLYSVSAENLKQVWRARSYSREAPWKRSGTARVVTSPSFVRFDPSGAGRPARMTYLTLAGDGKGFTEKTLVMEGSVIRESRNPQGR